MAIILPNGRNYFATGTGAPGVGYRLYTYVPGTNTPKATYTDSTGSTPNTNPVVADARGEMAVYWSGAYDVVLKDANDVTIWGPERLSDVPADISAASVTTTGDISVGDDLIVTGDATIGGAFGVTGASTLATVTATDLTTTGNTVLGNAAADTLNVGNGGIIKDVRGNVGLGVTPSLWGGLIATGVLELINGGSLGSNNVTIGSFFGSNLYYDGADWRYKADGRGFLFSLNPASSAVFLYTTATGTAGGVATLVTVMQYDAATPAWLFNGHKTRFENIAVACPTSAGTGSLTVIPHGGTKVPDQFSIRLRCVITEHGYAVGDEVDLVTVGGSVIYSFSADAANIYFRMPSAAAGTPQVFIASGGNSQPSVTAANWRLAVRAIWL